MGRGECRDAVSGLTRLVLKIAPGGAGLSFLRSLSLLILLLTNQKLVNKRECDVPGRIRVWVKVHNEANTG